MFASPVHPNSLVDPATHSPALLELISFKVSKPVIEYLVDCVVETVDYAMGRPTPSSSKSSRSRSRRPEHAKFTTFVKNVIDRAEITMQTILASLVYIDRAKPHLHIALEEWALERVFLGSMIVASKYLNDSTLKNVHWALCTGVFGKRDVGRIEREYLDVLDFELSITEADLLSHHQGLLNAVHPTTPFYRAALPFSHPHPATSRTTIPSPSSSAPELSPSSDESSSGSASPRTPSSLDSSPSYPHDKQHRPQNASTHNKKSLPSATLDSLLRAFPIPHSSSHQSVRVHS